MFSLMCGNVGRKYDALKYDLRDFLGGFIILEEEIISLIIIVEIS